MTETLELINARNTNLKVGDIVYYNLFGTLEECEVIKVLKVSDTMDEYKVKTKDGRPVGIMCNFELEIKKVA
jgi:hypothetical protein